MHDQVLCGAPAADDLDDEGPVGLYGRGDHLGVAGARPRLVLLETHDRDHRQRRRVLGACLLRLLSVRHCGVWVLGVCVWWGCGLEVSSRSWRPLISIAVSDYGCRRDLALLA